MAQNPQLPHRSIRTCCAARQPRSAALCFLQVVTDEMWAARASTFPEHTPSTREYYLLRSIFEEHFPSRQALLTVPTVRTLTLNMSA